jgi:hypothetical protein
VALPQPPVRDERGDGLLFLVQLSVVVERLRLYAAGARTADAVTAFVYAGTGTHARAAASAGADHAAASADRAGGRRSLA